MFFGIKKLQGKKALFVLPQDGYQDKEYNDTRKILEKNGVDISIGSQRIGLAKGKFGEETKVNVSVSEANADDYDVVIFIGGPGSVVYQQDKDAHRLAKESFDKNKVLAAICLAPTILAYAGLLKGKKATVWNGDSAQSGVLESNGAYYTGENVTVDNNIVTSDGPSSAEDFAKSIVKLLEET